MKIRYIPCFMLFFLPAVVLANNPLCQQKAMSIQQEIDFARSHNNQHRVNGLQQALSQVQANCSDEKLKAEHQQRIEKKKREVAEREQDLREATEKGNKEKITKRQKKLDEERNELQRLQTMPY